MYGFSYWMLPVLSGLTWLGMLLGMLIGWTVGTHREHYANMKANQSVAYISDVGATPRFKPMFIVLCCVTMGLLVLSFLADRWLRHRGRLTPNGSTFQKVLGVLAILFALAGTAGLILLSVFDVAHHKKLHDGFLLLFLGGYVISAICACWEFQRLGRHNRAVRVLRASFWVKLAFILVEVALGCIYAGLTFNSLPTGGAIVEWIVAYVFTLYIFSFAVDLYPAVHTRHGLPPKSAAEAIGVASAGGDDRESHDGLGAAAGANANGYDHAYDNNNNRMSQLPAELDTMDYGDAYGQSAARATRPARSSRVPLQGADESYADESYAETGTPQPTYQPYQPGRSYGR